MVHKIEKEIFGKKISMESGKVAKLANGSVVIQSEDSKVLVTVGLGEEKDADFLPLSVDYVEKTYAAGKIPGGYFKREGRQSENELLTCRLIDRPVRPLFPKGFRNELQVIATVISADENADTAVLSITGASAALTISAAPFEGPIAGVRVIRVDGKLIINPAHKLLEKADLNFVVAGTKDAIVMVEGGAEQVPEKEVLEAIYFAHKEMQPLIEMQEELRGLCGKEKVEFTPIQYDEAKIEEISNFLKPLIGDAVKIQTKQERGAKLKEIKQQAKDKFIIEDAENADELAECVSKAYDQTTYNSVRTMAFNEKVRIDGRDFKTVRPIDIEVGYLPRAHGSALFTRGETQAIVVATFGLESEAQYLDPLVGNDDKKRFMLHYNFPPFCVGEVRFLRGPGRREIGHGALAERALSYVMPKDEDFPYVVRIVSEITESNGSSSMASVCGATLALLQGGVPLKAPVAGVAMGLMAEDENFAILTDILGDEDHLGDMDFKVCGSEKGITALQMDIKIKGLSQEIMNKALEQAREARLHILSKMNEVIAEPQEELSRYAPKMKIIKVNPDKVRDIIGPGGKTIRSITESHDVKIDIDDNGTVKIAGVDPMALKGAISIIESLTAEAKIGEVYNGIVKRIADFGAFVEILPGVDGLVHISQLAEEKVRRVTDVVNEGDQVPVKVLDIDRQGKIRLSRKDALES